jgi:hypothetical protein
MVQRINQEEMMLLRLIDLQSLFPHYWSQLMLFAMQLLNDDERDQLREMIFDVEKMVLETEVVPRETEEGTVVWVERIKGDLSLYDIEMAIESNPDYYAYFERSDGTIVTKFDIERKLDRLKSWIYERVREKSVGKRFTRFR